MPNSDNNAVNAVPWDRLGDYELQNFQTIEARLRNVKFKVDDATIECIRELKEAALRQIAINNGTGNLPPTRKP